MRDPSATHRSLVSAAAAAVAAAASSSAWLWLCSPLCAASLGSWSVQVKYEGTSPEIPTAGMQKLVGVGWDPC